MRINDKLVQRHQGLKILNDDTATRFCYPVSSDELVFKDTSKTLPRAVGEILTLAEEAFLGKFSMHVDSDPQHALEGVDSRQNPHPVGPLATIEVWSLEPGSYDLVLKLPQHCTHDQAGLSSLIDQFIDRARFISNKIDTLDLLRFEAGPSMNLPKAQQALRQLEEKSGTKLDNETLLSFLKLDGPSLNN